MNCQNTQACGAPPTIPTDGQTTEPFFFPDVIMHTPNDRTFFGGGRNYHSYQRPDDCTFFFSGCNYEPAETSELVEPPPKIPTDGQTTQPFFFGRIYEPAR
jgi:hypothetical protein